MADKIENQPIHPCDSFIMKIDRIAAKTGIVATAVSTTITEVSIMPSVKHIEFTAKAKIKVILVVNFLHAVSLMSNI